MDITLIRKTNLKYLIKQEGNSTVLASRLAMSKSQLSQLRHDKNIGNMLARSIEEKLDLPHGWLDQIHTEALNPDEVAMLSIQDAGFDVKVVNQSIQIDVDNEIRTIRPDLEVTTTDNPNDKVYIDVCSQRFISDRSSRIAPPSKNFIYISVEDAKKAGLILLEHFKNLRGHGNYSLQCRHEALTSYENEILECFRRQDADKKKMILKVVHAMCD